ncbi:MAG: CoA-binding protein [Betaproteobacteria bacterium]|nr:CoA-binding protein [Betaproteobacteria bacterium]
MDAQPKAGSTAEKVAWVLGHCRNIAVVGLSPKPHRASFDVAQYMQSRGYRVIPINPNAVEVLGHRAFPNLIEAARHERIDLVNCFRNSEEIAPIVDEALAVGARALWLQLGVRNDEAVRRASQAGLVVVQDRCLKIDHKAVAGGQRRTLGGASTASVQRPSPEPAQAPGALGLQ